MIVQVVQDCLKLFKVVNLFQDKTKPFDITVLCTLFCILCFFYKYCGAPHLSDWHFYMSAV